MNPNRLLLLVAAVAAAAIAAVVLVLVGTGSGSSGDTTTAAATTPAATNPLTGVRQAGDTLGSATATATLLVFEDPQCPYCRAWTEQAFPTVVNRFVKTGRVNLAYRGIAIVGANSVNGLRAIYASAPQNKLWNMVDELYALQGTENSGWITADSVRQAAAAAGANADSILARTNLAAVTAKLRQAATQADSYGVAGTPTFVLERPLAAPQLLRVTALDAESFSSSLAAALQ